MEREQGGSPAGKQSARPPSARRLPSVPPAAAPSERGRRSHLPSPHLGQQAPKLTARPAPSAPDSPQLSCRPQAQKAQLAGRVRPARSPSPPTRPPFPDQPTSDLLQSALPRWSSIDLRSPVVPSRPRSSAAVRRPCSRLLLSRARSLTFVPFALAPGRRLDCFSPSFATDDDAKCYIVSQQGEPFKIELTRGPTGGLPPGCDALEAVLEVDGVECVPSRRPLSAPSGGKLTMALLQNVHRLVLLLVLALVAQHGHARGLAHGADGLPLRRRRPRRSRARQGARDVGPTATLRGAGPHGRRHSHRLGDLVVLDVETDVGPPP